MSSNVTNHPSLGEDSGGFFDETIARRGTNCVKWDETELDDVIPLWVADMDFRAAPAIQTAIRQRAGHGVFGYTEVGSDYYEAVVSWFERRHQWTIHRDEILYTTGVVPAVSVVIKALSMPGERVLILSPDYNCFFSSIRNNGCEVAESVLRFSPSNNRFEVDWEDFEAKCADEKTTLFLLCSPHNPTGRVWTRPELLRMNDICMKYGVKVISDEIHCELTMPGHRFLPFAACSDQCRQNSIVLNSPSKAFNIAGLQIANIVCVQPEWRRRIDRAININEVCDLNPFGPVALKAAYNESEDWLDELNLYLWGNYTALCDYAALHLPDWKVRPLEGTYLQWVDLSAYLKPQELKRAVQDKCRLAVDWGHQFFPSEATGSGDIAAAEAGKKDAHIRLNLATSRANTELAVTRLIEAMRG